MKAKKKPITIEVMQWTGKNKQELERFGDVTVASGEAFVKTPEGTMKAKPGDYIAKGVRGEFYPIDKQIFEETYEVIDG